MTVKYRLRQIVLLFGDIVVLYASLFFALWIRLQFKPSYSLDVVQHLVPFTFVFMVWLFVFFLFGLYDPRTLKNNLAFIRLFCWALTINIGTAVIFFYFVSPEGFAPKTNLAIFAVIFSILFFAWRRFYNRIIGATAPAIRLLLIGNGEEVAELADFITANPQLGYRICHRLGEYETISSIKDILRTERINLIATTHNLKNDSGFTAAVIRNLHLDINVIDTALLYEMLLKKIPVSSLEGAWFIEHLARGPKQINDALIRFCDLLGASLLAIIFSPFMLLATAAISLDSKGPLIYKQKRIGKNGGEFVLYKLRTMTADAEKDGARWAQKNDPRITRMGTILRKTHIDELPQMLNVVRGELSLIGPRPERPEFVKNLREEIPYYDLRHVIRPGFSGWAQLNYPYGSSIQDAYKKLQYDIYYVKNRSVLLYFVTLFKTAKLLVYNPK